MVDRVLRWRTGSCRPAERFGCCGERWQLDHDQRCQRSDGGPRCIARGPISRATDTAVCCTQLLPVMELLLLLLTAMDGRRCTGSGATQRRRQQPAPSVLKKTPLMACCTTSTGTILLGVQKRWPGSARLLHHQHHHHRHRHRHHRHHQHRCRRQSWQSQRLRNLAGAQKKSVPLVTSTWVPSKHAG